MYDLHDFNLSCLNLEKKIPKGVAFFIGRGGGSGVTILLSTYIVTFNIVPNEVCNSPHFMQEIFVTMTLVREGTYKTQTCKQEYALARQIEPRRGLQKRK